MIQHIASKDSVFELRLFKKIFHQAVAIFCASTVLIACTPSFKEGPPRLFSLSEETAIARKSFGLPNFQRYYSLPPVERVAYRNNYIAGRMYAIDTAYTDYEASLTTERQSAGFLASTTNIALNTAATFVPSVSTKDILNGVAVGLGGTYSAYSDEVLLKQTVQLLQTQMRANRSTVASLIIRKMGQGDSAYPLGFAMSDLEEYYRAGTITGGMIGAHATVSVAETVAQGEKDSAIIYSLSQGNAQKLLRASLIKNGRYNAEQAKKLNALLRKRNVTADLSLVVSNPQYDLVAKQLAQDAGLLN